MSGNTNNTNLHQVNDSQLSLQLTRVQPNFQETQSKISALKEQESECNKHSKCSPSNTRQANHHEAAEASNGGSCGGELGEAEDSCGGERLKRQRVEVGGRVWIPDIWGQEGLLKDWIDCNAFDATMVSTGLMSARAALVREGRRANSGRLRIENRCS